MPDDHFDISAHVVLQLGEELVSDGLTALLELAKNSYDAGSPYVKIEIFDDGVPEDSKFTLDSSDLPGYIRISDEGVGMSREQVISGWLMISYSAKRETRKTGNVPKGQRFPLGEKGLGRLSAQRIGRYFELTTNHEGKQTTLSIDWADFKEGAKLSNIPINLATSSTTEKNGTKLLLYGIKDHQLWKSRNDVAEKLRQLVSPYSFSATNEEFPEDRFKILKESANPINPFLVYYFSNGSKQDIKPLSEELSYATVQRFIFQFEDKYSELSFSGLFKLSGLVARRGRLEIREVYEKYILPDKGEDFFKFLSNPQKNPKYFIPNLIHLDGEPWFCKIITTIPCILTTDTPKKQSNLLNHNYSTPGKFAGMIDVFNIDQDLEIEGEDNSKSDIETFKNTVKRHSGIRVYKDGFSIRPYGFDGNDWLKLGEAKTDGSSFYALRPSNVIGSIFLSGKDSVNLVEVTSREGFVKNLASENFFAIMAQIKQEANNFLNRIRRSFNSYAEYKKESESNEHNSIKPLSKDEANKTKTEIKTIAKNLENLGGILISKEKSSQKEINQFKKEIQKLIEKSAPIIDSAISSELQKEVAETRVRNINDEMADMAELAGLGLIAEMISHDILAIVSRLNHRSKQISEYIQNSNIQKEAIMPYIDFVRSTGSTIEKQISHLNPALRYVREDKKPFNLSKFLRELAEYHSERLKTSRIEVRFIDGNPIFSPKFNSGRLLQVIDNLIGNSQYWLMQYQKENPSFHGIITIQTIDKQIKLWDNGLGIHKSAEIQIFQPFYSTKPKGEGRGLGLYICQKLLEPVSGTITLAPERNEHGNRYRFVIDLSSL